MNRLFHSHSFRYALALWLATVLALLVSFFVQLEPAQWSAITVWIIFMQDPRLNYSKIIWWAFGTIVGALAAVLLIVWFNQMPALGIAALALWLAVCSGSSRLVTSYRAYGLVLAGYTCAIVTMSAVDQPDQIFHIAITRVSCIAIGMTAAVLLIFILLPKHRHWRETLHHLGEHLKACLSQAAKALGSDAGPPPQFTWRHLADRLSTLEHTLDLTTAESADSRIHAPQARSLVATLFDLLAKAQAIEVHLTRIGQPRFATALTSLLADARTLLTFFAGSVSTVPSAGPVEAAQAEIEGLRQRIADRRRAPAEDLHDPVSERFVLDRLEEILKDFDHAIQDWAGLFGPWTARRVSHLAEHRDYPGAVLYGFRMFLTINLAGVFWSVTRWPSGSQFVLFIAVVCSLLSLVDYAPRMGLAFIKSATFCAIAAYVEAFCLLPKCQGFLAFAFILGLFLLPAAYAYRHPRLLGSAVVSMLIFYGLTMPANAMDYNIAAFLNNGIALLVAAAGGFFAFHAVPSFDARARRFWVMYAVRRELALTSGGRDGSSDQSWTSRMFDRLRLLHRTSDDPEGMLIAENELLISLQLGLRQRRLRKILAEEAVPPEEAEVMAGVFRECREISRHPGVVALFLRSACLRLEEMFHQKQARPGGAVGIVAELREMTHLLETSNRLYHA